MILQLIDRYKRLRTRRFLGQTYQYSYAFVGMGQHSLTNLYPVLHYLGVPLKYICVTSERKAMMIERKFPHVKAASSLDTLLNDEEVKGILVSASPSAHFSIASQILKSGKSLFIEKPPCQTLEIINYDLHYLTGAYPEGDTLLDLFIHPLDLVTFLFGKPEIVACQQVASASYLLMFRHRHIVGTLELSTDYTWTAAEESLKVCTSNGIYRLSNMDELTFESKPSTILGIPFEKVHTHTKTVEYLYARNSSNPTLPNNQIYSQGYFSEIQAFVSSIEHNHSCVLTDIATVKPTYETIMEICSILQTHSRSPFG